MPSRIFLPHLLGALVTPKTRRTECSICGSREESRSAQVTFGSEAWHVGQTEQSLGRQSLGCAAHGWGIGEVSHAKGPPGRHLGPRRANWRSVAGIARARACSAARAGLRYVLFTRVVTKASRKNTSMHMTHVHPVERLFCGLEGRGMRHSCLCDGTKPHSCKAPE